MGERIEICHGDRGPWTQVRARGWALSVFAENHAILGLDPEDAPRAQSSLYSMSDARRAAAIAAICGVEVSAEEIRSAWAACLLRLEAAKEAA